ncbi:O-antigen translocase, partial [Vibrio splendidus]|uniref:O-antigen translocase n=1 Tax=Vibrio splendidus TaxID=29497 RepID=UPI00148C43B6
MLTLFKMLVGLVVSKIVAIHLGPAGIAIIGQYQNFLQSLNGIVNSPVSTGIVALTSKHRCEHESVYSAWWKAGLHISLAVFAIILMVVFVFATDISKYLFGGVEYLWVIYISCLLLPLTSMGTLCVSVLNAREEYNKYFKLNFISIGMSAFFTILLIYIWNIEGALIALSLQFPLVFIAFSIFYNKLNWFKFTNFFGKISKEKYKDIRKYIFMAIFSALTMPLALVIIRNLILENFGAEVAGYWQSVWKLSEVYLSVITIALGTYFLPKISRLRNFSEIIKEIKGLLILVLPLLVILSFMIFFLKDYIILLLYTEEFLPAGELLKYQLVGDFFKIFSWILAYPMIAQANVKWFVITQALFTIIFVVISYFLVPLYLSLIHI